MFTLLVDELGILTAKGCEQLTNAFQTFTFPPGWKRIQSPCRHLKSWRIQELARGAIILPIVLRIWLKEEHIKKDIRYVMKQIAKDYFSPGKYSHNTQNFTAVEWLTAACWEFARSILTICGPFSYSMKQHFHGDIISGRSAIQFLIQASVNMKRLQAGNLFLPSFFHSRLQIYFTPSNIKLKQFFLLTALCPASSMQPPAGVQSSKRRRVPASQDPRPHIVHREFADR